MYGINHGNCIGGTIQGNIVQSTGMHGINVFGASNAGFGFCTVVGNSVFSTGDAGIRIRGVRLIVNSNAVHGSSGSCYLAGNSMSQMIISNNFAQGCGAYGFDLNAGITYSTFSGNVVEFQTNAFLITPTHCSISSNHAVGNMELNTCLASSLVGNWVDARIGTCTNSKEAANSWN